MGPSKRVCVYCGSSKGDNPAYAKQAKMLGQELASHNFGVVYGGGSVGLMNEIADGALSRGGEVQGVIPTLLDDKDHAHPLLTKRHITSTLHERKALMAELADAFITLPGGYGTLEELMEIITWAQHGLHDKPVILFNIDGYYNQLIEFIEQAMNEGFINANHEQSLRIADCIEDCFNFLPSNP
ncbi:TIGR00730 family Rossman fold protein [Fodinibius salsisoli]|uniref:Cytokinin riboside 5'-monophosphate phosphoribohydrolase n=1 Tax=Fodinibius salsisoli TaxID=2820877 RepID=A0ABT3PLQ8_9BACT|nr:TIGR00730 family Rossman fold protein [Fodinibius salsisoli]MCW9706693.1 TIGR00730 family Rossman fold protein [Fodinibius salsisoli]